MQGNPVHPMTSNRAEFLDGFRMVLPILIVPTAFSFIVGAASVQKGLSPLEATLMSMGVFAGGGQMLALEVWHDPRAWLLVMLAAVSINVRFALQAASVQRKINHFSFWQRWLAISTLTDPAWGMSEVRHLTRQVTFAFIMGITAPIYLIWAGGTLAGAVLGKLLEDPRVYGLDYAFTVVFIALALPFWKRSGAVLPSLAAGGVAIAAKLTGFSALYVFMGALAGVAVAFVMAWHKARGDARGA
jgi:4-azaleucine resistance transporter AzlC